MKALAARGRWRLAVAGALLAAAAQSAARELPATVRDALAKAGVPPSAVGALVVPVEAGPAIVSHHADRAFNPASVIKLVTTYAGLELLGPAFTFRTQWLTTGELAQGALSGDLIVRGGGDPKLTYEKLWQVAHQLRSRGLREVRGDVILDRGYFAPPPHDPGKFDGQTRRAYNVGPDALLVNFRTIEFRFVPEGNGVRVLGDPDLPTVEIASRLRLVKEPCGDWRRGLKFEVEELGLLATVIFSGTYPADCGELSWPLSVFDAARYAENVLRWVWVASGGAIRGKVRAGPTPPEAKLFHVHESDPLAELIRGINKFSNNVMARQLFLALSAEKAGAPGDVKASERLVADWLKAKGIGAPELAIENGAGLSRTDRISPATLAAMLRSAWASPVMPELIASLPVFGADGTLRKRIGASAGQAHLKGGTLTGVQSVAGFVLDTHGRRWIVVMFANHENANRAQPAMDALVDWVRQRPR